ncbi:MAG TPA: hypothetical protein VM434_08830 [Beijerinckiaceae bacterium]|nr:hypothetical protein [Beijerinckiaceae bacterium]
MRLALAFALLLAGPAAASPFDGSWGIEVITERGPCDRVYRYYVEVEDGAVRLRSMTGQVSPRVAGRVQGTGRVNGAIGAPDDPVTVQGRLDEGKGTGDWAAPARGCAGRWVAERR